MMFDCFSVRLVPLFSIKAKISKWPKKSGNRTNMDITLSFLAKSLDKHGITLVHITYPPLNDEQREIKKLSARSTVAMSRIMRPVIIGSVQCQQTSVQLVQKKGTEIPS